MGGLGILSLVSENVFCILHLIGAGEKNVISRIDSFVCNTDIVPEEEKLYLLLNG